MYVDQFRYGRRHRHRNHLLQNAGVQLVEALHNVSMIQPRSAVFGHRMQQIVTVQFQQVAIARFRPRTVQIQSRQHEQPIKPVSMSTTKTNSLWSLVDGAQLQNQSVQPTVFHLFRQLVVLHVALVLQCVQLRVESGAYHRHQVGDATHCRHSWRRLQQVAAIQCQRFVRISKFLQQNPTPKTHYNKFRKSDE